MEFSNIVLGQAYAGQLYDFGLTTSGADRFTYGDLTTDHANQMSKAIGTDVVVLLGGNDSATDDSGSRIYFGNAGNDTIDGADGNDTIAAGRDNDLITGGNGNDVLAGNLGQDTVEGGSGNDAIFGGRGNDIITGGRGDDTISGDRDDDTITGGSGFDVLTGGSGRDRFVLESNNGVDTISDFITGTDVMQLPDGVSASDISLVSSGSNTIVRDASGNSMAILQGVASTSLSTADFVGTETSDSGDTAPDPASAFEAEVLRLTNEYRLSNGLNALTPNPILSIAAETHSQNMADFDFFSHTGADGSNVVDRALAAGYESSFVGENLGVGYTTPEGILQGWIESDGHRANLLHPDYTTLGVGYVFLQDDTGSQNWNHYWAQVFG